MLKLGRGSERPTYSAPIWSLATPDAPSQPSTYRARTLIARRRPSLTVTVTSASSWASPVTVCPSRRSTRGGRPTWARSTSSTTGCGTCWPASANRSSRSVVSPNAPSKSVTHRPDSVSQNITRCDHATGSGAAARSASASPHRRRCSIVRTLVVLARGRRCETCARRLDHHAVDAPVRQFGGGGEPGRAAAGDQDGGPVGARPIASSHGCIVGHRTAKRKR